MSKSAISVLLCAFALVAPATLGQEMPEKACTALVITGDDDGLGRASPVFSARETLDITLRMVFPATLRPEPDDAVRVVMTTPNGFTFQELEFPIVAPGSKEIDRPVPGYLFPVKTLRLAASTDGKGEPAQIVTLEVPVGGTAMTENGLYGTWTVVARIGDSRSCGGKFQLRP